MTNLEPTFEVHAGEILAGKYRIEKALGMGGMGVVVAARHLQLGELVAIKFLSPNLTANVNAVNRFTREARASVRIKNEHVARIIDVGQLENGTPYMVMEYLEGSNLAQWLADRGPLTITLAVELILQACEAVAEAHSLGIVHRDLKPANLLCVRNSDGSPSVKVLDFGISKFEQSSAHDTPFSLTESTCILGSPFYMSPEQFRSARDVNVCTDLWSLGVILFELLSGHVPFNANSVPELYHSIVTKPTPSIRAYRPEVSEKLDRVIQHCLAKSQTQRYQSVAALAADLQPFASKRAKLSVERILGTARAAERSTNIDAKPSDWDQSLSLAESQETASGWNRAVSSPRPGRGIALFSVTAVLGILIASMVLINRNKVAKVPVESATISKFTATGIVGRAPSINAPDVSANVSPAGPESAAAIAKETVSSELIQKQRSVTTSKQNLPKSVANGPLRNELPTTPASVPPLTPNEYQANKRSVYDDMD
jgi:serine/threonine-protein kinase